MAAGEDESSEPTKSQGLLTKTVMLASLWASVWHLNYGDALASCTKELAVLVTYNYTADAY